MGIIRKSADWAEDRTGIAAAIKPILDHKVPRTDWKSGWWYVFGSAVLVAFIVQVITGIALATSYVSSSGEAYNSLKYITNEAFLGNFMRGVHYFGASAMVLFVGAHMLHVYLIGAYKFPREMQWLSGVVLLLLTLAMGFTGQLLRWDQNAVWSVVVGASQASRTPFIGNILSQFILAGNTLGGATLSRFFSFHVFFIPALVFGFIGFHLYLVIRNGVSEPPEIGKAVDPKTYRKEYHELLEKDGVPFWPDALWRDAVFAVILIVGVAILAIIFGPPLLDNPPDPSILRAAPRPDWYLLWYFAVLALVPPGITTFVILLFPLVGFAALFVLPIFANKGERHPLRRPWAMGIVLMIVISIITLWIAGDAEPWSPKIDAQPLPIQVVASKDPGVVSGAQLFNSKGCEYCHRVGEYGGVRGPNLTNVGSRLNHEQLTVRILNGGNGMPQYGNNLKPGELNSLLAFLESRKGQNDKPVVADATNNQK